MGARANPIPPTPGCSPPTRPRPRKCVAAPPDMWCCHPICARAIGGTGGPPRPAQAYDPCRDLPAHDRSPPRIRDEITAHLQALQASAPRNIQIAMRHLVRERNESSTSCPTIAPGRSKSIGEISALTLLAAAAGARPYRQQGRRSSGRRCSLRAPEWNSECTSPHPRRQGSTSQRHLHGCSDRDPAQPGPQGPLLSASDRGRKTRQSRHRRCHAPKARCLRQRGPQIRTALERRRNWLTRDTVDSGLAAFARAPE